MKTALRLGAESLRRQGKSIKEIAQKVGVSQSTASRWCSGIILSIDQRGALEKKRQEAGVKALTPWILRNRDLKKEGHRETKSARPAGYRTDKKT